MKKHAKSSILVIIVIALNCINLWIWSSTSAIKAMSRFLFFLFCFFQPQTLLFEWGSASAVGSRLMLACVWWRLAWWLNSCHNASPPDLCWNSIRTPPCRCQSHIAIVTPVSEVSGKIAGKWLVLMMVGVAGLYRSGDIFQLYVNTSSGFIIHSCVCVCVCASHLERDLLDNKQFVLRVCVSLHGLSVRRGCFSPSCPLLSLYLVTSGNFQETYWGKK